MTVSSLRHLQYAVNLLVCQVERVDSTNTHIFSGGNLTDLPFQLMTLPGSEWHP